MSDSPTPMWIPDPDAVASAQITAFARLASERAGRDLTAYADLQAWSATELEGFWRAVWDFFEVRADIVGDVVLVEPPTGPAMPGTRWFPGTRLNYTANVFRDRPADGIAIRGLQEDTATDEVTWSRLEAEVGSIAATLREAGVEVGDRVVGYVPNAPEAVAAFLATVSLGAIWSACGMDYAADAALARFRQLDPVALVTANGFRLSGKVVERHDAVAAIRAGLPTLRTTIAINRDLAAPVPDALDYAQVVATPSELVPVPVDFEHPLWVLFSSGTTGLPKGIVHGHGGVVLEHLKALSLNKDVSPDDVFWWFTTPSWMMWNLQIGGLLVGATIVTYDGSPAYPSTDAVWMLTAREGVTVLGTSPGYVAACAKAGCAPGVDHDLHRLQAVGVTGSTLPTPSYHWLADNLPTGVQLMPTSGGTDVAAGFVGGAPSVPVWAGEISTAALGVALDAFDEQGASVRGRVGELVVTRPMPTMPLHFWNDPDGSRLREAYFDTYPGVWRHGDWITITERGSVTIHGRSDATLNRNGVRMGSADIYEVVEQLPEVTEALVVGIEEDGGGYWMPMFVHLADGVVLDADLDQRLRQAIRQHASARHVPDEIVAVRGIPHTRTGKKLEVPVKRMLQGSVVGAAFDPGGVDDPTLVDDFLAVGARRRAAASAS
ncbi:acetoacetate--CoA ligase [Dermatophilaceae bacterium Soc4.6]